MKTPREILFDRHEAAGPKLDGVRRNALATLAEQKRAHPFSFWHFIGLGAAWLLVLLLHINQPADTTLHIAADKIPSSRELLAALRENRRELLELTDPPPVVEPVAAPPRRSERAVFTEIV